MLSRPSSIHFAYTKRPPQFFKTVANENEVCSCTCHSRRTDLSFHMQVKGKINAEHKRKKKSMLSSISESCDSSKFGNLILIAC